MSVEQKVKQIIVEQLGVDENQVDNTASFVDDLGADSLDIVELARGAPKNRITVLGDDLAGRILWLRDLDGGAAQPGPEPAWRLCRPLLKGLLPNQVGCRQQEHLGLFGHSR